MPDATDEQHDRFWRLADQLVAAHPIVIDRAGGTGHPRFPEIVYPFDYGYLEGTGAVVTVDVVKADSEVKWLVGCTEAEMAAALATHRTAWQAAILLTRNG